MIMRSIWALPTEVDAKLMERTGLDPVTLARVRKDFLRKYNSLTYHERKALGTASTSTRLALMVQTNRKVMTPEQRSRYLSYMDLNDSDVDEMVNGGYPITPFVIRVYSALMGIKIDYLLLGSMPSRDAVGASIELIKF